MICQFLCPQFLFKWNHYTSIMIKSMWIFKNVWSSGNVFNTWSNCSLYLCVCPQAHMLVCRALSNMLLLPWPNLPENEQQWQTRSSNHTSLLAALTREYRILRATVNITPRQPDLNNSQSFFLSFFFFWYFYYTDTFFPPSFVLFKCQISSFFYFSESSDTADPACAQRHCRQHLWGIHQVTSDLLPESSGVCPSVPHPFPSVYSAARSVSHLQFCPPQVKKRYHSMKIHPFGFCTFISKYPSMHCTGKMSKMITLHVTKDQINVIIQSKHFCLDLVSVS